MPRPTKLNADVQAKIVQRLGTGVTITATCDSVGIHYQTFRNWMTRGQKEAERRENPRVKSGTKQWNEENLFFEFFDAATRAQADGLVHATARFREGMNPSDTVSNATETFSETRLRTVTHKDGTKEQVPYKYEKTVKKHTVTNSPGDWRAAMEYLARRDPDNWANTNKVTGKDGGAMKIEWVSPLTEDDDIGIGEDELPATNETA